MSKIQASNVRESVKNILTFSNDEKPRKFAETVELQIGLKNYDPQRDKRFSGTVKLPNVPKPKMKLCILADAAHIDQAKAIGLEFMSVDDLKKLNKNKKLIKKLGEIYFLFFLQILILLQLRNTMLSWLLKL
jgi:large subunit ribosomal protein L10Ae